MNTRPMFIACSLDFQPLGSTHSNRILNNFLINSTFYGWHVELELLDKFLKSFFKSLKEIKKDNKEIYRHANGYADLENKISINQKSVYRIYSMSKPVTGVAIMQLVENGKLRLNDKVSKYIPAFKDTKVINLDFQA